MTHSAGAMGSTTTPRPAALNESADVTRHHARPRRRDFRRWMIALVVLGSWPLVAATPDGSTNDVPPNAHPKRSGTGWECAHGYREVDRSCLAVEVPANGYLDSSGLTWQCRRGFQKSDGTCAPVEVPPHAFLSTRGNAWACERGYRRHDERCAAVMVPENAYLAGRAGDMWPK